MHVLLCRMLAVENAHWTHCLMSIAHIPYRTATLSVGSITLTKCGSPMSSLCTTLHIYFLWHLFSDSPKLTRQQRDSTASDKDKTRFINMPPIGDQAGGTSPADIIAEKIKSHQVMMFSKSWCPYCLRVSLFFVFSSRNCFNPCSYWLSETYR